MNHDEVWDRIPWLVNGRADDTERENIEAHLRLCEECRQEVAVQRQVMSTIANDKRIDVVPGAAFQRLWDRISADEDDDDQDLATSQPIPPPPAVRLTPAPVTRDSRARDSRSDPRGRSMIRWLAAAVIVEAVGLMALTAALSSRDAESQPPAEYRTVTSAAPQAPRAIIRAVFSPTLKVSDLQQLLEKSGLQIVSGPTEAGVYTLAASSTVVHERTDTALSELRTHPAVRFAEPVGK